ncbi:MAG: hypothetical protein CRN43_21680, partial [Candidatus Nephrothrix sp. EaCA]
TEAGFDLLKCIIEQSQISDATDVLIEKGTALVKILSDDRKRADTFRSMEWEDFLKLASGQKKAEWIKN